MAKKIEIQLFVGESASLNMLHYYLPQDSQTITHLKAPLEILVRDYGSLGEDMSEVIPVFCRIWPEVLEFLASLSKKSVSLIYFAGLATDFDLITVIPFLPLTDDEDKRFFTSEVCKDAVTKNPAQMRICVEYSYDSFKKMTGPDGFEHFSGTIIMGLVTTEGMVKELLRINVNDKDLLERVVKNEQVFCWWICGDDLNRLTIWHKSYSGMELASRLQEKALQQFGYPIKVYCD